MAGEGKKRSGRFTLIVIAVLLLIVTADLFRVRGRIEAAQAEQTSLEMQLAAQQQENASLEAALGKAKDPEYLHELARSELGYVTPGERVFYDVSSK